MSKFAVKRLETPKGVSNVKLLIENGNCYLETFYSSLVDNEKYRKEYGKLLQYIERDSDGGNLPSEKKKDITPKCEFVKEYEFRSKNLRIYAIKQANGKLIILGGLKKNQSKDIAKFRLIKNRYLIFYKKLYER